MRTVFPAAQWGASLAELRHSARLSAAQVVARLKPFGIQIERASIYAYEAGRVAAPDAGVIWGLAQVYGVGVADLIASLVSVRNGGDSLDSGSFRTPERSPYGLGDDEHDLLQLWRRLTPQRRKVCREFIVFESRSPDLRNQPARVTHPNGRKPR
jgi:transcriptional regulator with XRE-family HTH domain